MSKTIESYAFSGCYKISTVYSYATTPPSLGTTDPFEKGYASSNTLFVPNGCTAAYKSNGYSTYFGTIKELS